MGLVGRKLITLEDGRLGHWCPACGRLHAVPVDGDKPDKLWTWNGSIKRPTISPSVKVRLLRGRREDVCYYRLRNGVLEFFSECSHVLSGRSVPLPDVPLHEIG